MDSPRRNFQTKNLLPECATTLVWATTRNKTVVEHIYTRIKWKVADCCHVFLWLIQSMPTKILSFIIFSSNHSYGFVTWHLPIIVLNIAIVFYWFIFQIKGWCSSPRKNTFSLKKWYNYKNKTKIFFCTWFKGGWIIYICSSLKWGTENWSKIHNFQVTRMVQT